MKNMLIVDDEPDQRDYLKCIFEMEGYDVREAPDGRAALAFAQERLPNIVITDVFMPGMDGLEVISNMKALGPKIKIVAMSGGGMFGHVDYLEHAKKLGADAIITKPFPINNLINLVGSMSF